jgi:D-aspartate ligase
MLRCFDGSGIPVVLATPHVDEVMLASRFAKHQRVIASFDDEASVVADLEALAHTFSVRPVLFYGNDRQLLVISRNRERLARGYRFTMPPADVVEAMVDKGQFARCAEAHGLPVPVTAGAHDADRVPLPCVIKPNVHIGWFTHKELFADGPKKALIATTPDELRAIRAGVSAFTDDFVVQQYIPGGEDQIYSYHAYVDAGGGIHGRFAGKKIRTFPREAGISTYLGLVKDPRVLAIGDRTVAALGIVGPVKIDLKRHADTGELFVLEVNARFNLWHYLGAASGINLPRIAYADLVGDPILTPTEYETNIHWLSFGDDLRSFLRSYHPAGDLGWLDWLSSLRGKKIYDVFAWRDPLPWIATMLEQVRSRMARVVPA